jgi:competence protein ComEC
MAEIVAQLDRLFLWIPVAFGLGAAVYLGLKTEPPLAPAAAAAATLSAGALAIAWRGGSRALIAGLLLAAMAAAGFSVAKLRSDHVAAPIVPTGLGVAVVEGFVVDVDTPSQSGPRILVAPTYVSHLADLRQPSGDHATAAAAADRPAERSPAGAGLGDPREGAARSAAGARRAGQLRFRPGRLVRRGGRRRPGARAA